MGHAVESSRWIYFFLAVFVVLTLLGGLLEWQIQNVQRRGASPWAAYLSGQFPRSNPYGVDRQLASTSTFSLLLRIDSHLDRHVSCPRLERLRLPKSHPDGQYTSRESTQYMVFLHALVSGCRLTSYPDHISLDFVPVNFRNFVGPLHSLWRTHEELLT